MNATTIALLTTAAPLVSSIITGALVHFAHARHLEIHADNAQLAPDILQGVTDLVHATGGKFVDHVPTLMADAEKVVVDLRNPPAPAAAPPSPAPATA